MRLLLTTVAILGMGISAAHADGNASAVATAESSYDEQRPVVLSPNSCDPAVLLKAGIGAAANCVYGMFGMPVEGAVLSNAVDQPNRPPNQNPAPPTIDDLP